MKGLSRFLSTLAVLVLAFGGIAVWPGGGAASADPQEPVKLTAPQTVVREYDPLVATDPANQSGYTQDPTTCSTAPHCDTIPLELVVSDELKNSDTEDYFLRLTIEWDNAGGDNVNAYLYDDPYAGEFYIASGATAEMPEKINLYRPEKKKYILVVHNTTGVNAGYKLTAAITVEPFGGAPDFGGVNENPSRPTTTRPSNDNDDEPFFDDSDDTPAPPPAIVDNGFGPPPPLADVERDESLSALARDRGDFESSLTAPDFTLQEEEAPPPDPVSGATVALLGGLLPASLVGGGVFWLRRKGGTATAGF
ncbi:MAG TPA: hypothetical protein VMY88_00940 [Acidimicrobiales bacterium]|nr:hypothetical protein [Acidimicrobiales bacterium]